MEHEKVERKSIHLRIERDNCQFCNHAAKEGFFSQLNKLLLGPEGTTILTESASSKSRAQTICPRIACSFSKYHPNFSPPEVDVFNGDYQPHAQTWIRANWKDVTIQNVQDFCDRFVLNNQSVIFPRIFPRMTTKEALFCNHVFMIKDNRDTSCKKISHYLLPESVIEVRKMIQELGLVGRVNGTLEALDDLDSTQSPPKLDTVHVPVKNDSIVLKITGDLEKPLDERLCSDFDVLSSPKCMNTVVASSKTRELLVTRKYAVMPCEEAWEMLKLAKKRDQDATINRICQEDLTRFKFERYNRKYVDFLKIEDDANVPPESLYLFENNEIVFPNTHGFEFKMLVSDLEGDLKNIRNFLRHVVDSKPLVLPFTWTSS